MPTGTVKWFNTTKGYGFIAPESGGNDVFVHISAVERSGLTGLADDQKVTYELTEGRGAGQSWMWHLHVDVRLTEVMTATLRYDGRRPSTGETIHTGRFHLTARF